MENWLQIRQQPAYCPEEKKKFYLRKFPILGNNLYDWFIWTRFVYELKRVHPINGTRNYYNVLIPTFSEMLYYLSGTKALQFICMLRNCEHVKRICLWVSTAYCSHQNARFLMASCLHWADLVIHIESSGTHLTMTQSPRNPGGGVTEAIQRHRYKYEKHMKPFDFYLEICKRDSAQKHCSPRKTTIRSIGIGTEQTSELSSTATIHQNTFKIDLKDDELAARNSLKLPYERYVKMLIPSLRTHFKCFKLFFIFFMELQN